VLAAFVAAGVLAGFGIGAAGQATLSPRMAVPSSAIPAPPRSNTTFVEDDNLTAQDNQGNILQSSARGLVRISRGGNVVGSGLVLTPSGKVLTSDQILRGAGTLTARLVLSGVTFGARVIGADPAADLALLQMHSSNGGAFPTVKLGNSADIVASTSRSQQFSWHMPGEVLVTALGTSGAHDGAILDVGNLTGLNATATAGARRLSGLLRTTAQVLPGQETGGPLVDLSGEVIGLDVTGTGSGLHSAGYAIPINDALTIARQVQASCRAK
jgi:S1-C subfamily serine protease